MKKAFLIISVAALISLGANGPKSTKVSSWVEDDIPYLVDFYQQRHMNPEISLQEEETSKALAAELRKVGFEVTEGVGGYGIVGMMKNGDGPTILYRTDMDALPMYEKTGLSYASNVSIKHNNSETGVMHSCGHDMHMTTWVGTARAMANNKDDWKGTLMMIGQPAEEIGAGARMMLEAGLYEKFGAPDFGIGHHCSPALEAGKIGLISGYTLANAESIEIDVFGVGGHGAVPNMTIDPVVLASSIIMDLQTIVSRNVNPLDDAVVTVGAIKGGTVGNIIPDQVTLKLTVRTFKEEVRQLVHQRIREICKGNAVAAGLPETQWPEVRIPEEFTPSNYNDPALTKVLITSAEETIGSQNVIATDPIMGAEDFAMYGRTQHDVPTAMFWLGTVTNEKLNSPDLPGLHSPFYYPESEPTIRTGVTVTTNMLLDLFEANN
ncbi:MAG: amidohydrolase [Bacteroidota bacterium]